MTTEQVHGFIIHIDPLTSPNDLEKIQHAIFMIRGVQNIRPILKPFECYGLQSAAERRVAELLVNSLTS